MNVSGRLYKIKFILNSIFFFFQHIFVSIGCISDVREKFSYFTVTYYITISCILKNVKKKCIYISNYYGHYCQMPVNYLQNLARPFLSKNSNLNYYTEKKTHWKNPKTYSGFIFCCSLNKAFTQLPHKNCLGFFSECVNFLNVFIIKS